MGLPPFPTRKNTSIHLPGGKKTNSETRPVWPLTSAGTDLGWEPKSCFQNPITWRQARARQPRLRGGAEREGPSGTGGSAPRRCPPAGHGGRRSIVVLVRPPHSTQHPGLRATLPPSPRAALSGTKIRHCGGKSLALQGKGLDRKRR